MNEIRASQPQGFIQWSLVGVSLGCVILVSLLVIDSHRARLAHIPGPFLARYTDLWALYDTWAGQRNGSSVSRQRALTARYGDTVRTGPRMVSVYDPAAVPVIYGVRARLDKGDSYVAFRQAGVTTSLLSIPDEKTHSQYRKPVANAYSMTSLKGFEPYVDDIVSRLEEVCDDHARQGTPMNISRWCHYYGFEVISKITTGTPLGFMEGQGQDAYGLIKRVQAFGAYVELVSHMPWLHKVVVDNPVMRTSRPSPFLNVIGGFAQARFRKPDPEDQPRPDLLSHFVATHMNGSQFMDQKQVVIQASGNLIAGGLSPSATFDHLFGQLVTQQDIHERIYQELRSANVKLPVSYDVARSLPYLEGAIKESYRLHHSIEVNLTRVTGANGLDLPSGIHIPPFTDIGSPTGAMNRNLSIFGADADEYKPERWLQGKNETTEDYSERRSVMERTDLTFGHGSRTCIGKNIAHLEIFKAAATLLAQFKFEAIGEPKDKQIMVRVIRRETA